MSPSSAVARVVSTVRHLDARLSRRRDRRRILVDARTPVNYTMFAPVHRALERDPRVEVYFIASEEPARAREIYREAAAGIVILSPPRAARMRFDAYVASDFMWAWLPRGTRRVQMFHGVAGKYGFDAPEAPLTAWGRLWFINERRLRNCVAAGAVAADSPAIRLTGMPKVDCLVDGSIAREEVLQELGLDPGRPVVLYAPTWSPASSLNVMGLPLIERLLAMPVNLVVKLHDRLRDERHRYSGGRNWTAILRDRLPRGRAALATGHDICPYLVAADVMITDHSSAGFEYLLRDRPLVRIHLPALLELAHVHPLYVALLAEASSSATDVGGTVQAVADALADPSQRARERQAVARELFFEPGSATARCVAALYEEIDLEAPATSRAPAGLARGPIGELRRFDAAAKELVG